MTNTNQEQKLKPCPFCGSNPNLYKHNLIRPYIACTNMMCFCSVKTIEQDNEEAAIKAWNTRPTSEKGEADGA